MTMQLPVLLRVLLTTLLSASALASTNNAPTSTSILAINFLLNDPPRGWSCDSDPRGLKVETPPILSDHDFVEWNLTNHTFVITAGAAERVAQRCYERDVPFVLSCCGQAVYAGMFTTMLSSSAKDCPVILTDSIKMTQVPNDMLLKFGGCAIGTSNVTLVIGRSYPATDVPSLAADKRDDKRIVAAVRKLFKGDKR
jgi:hypothetical protein